MTTEAGVAPTPTSRMAADGQALAAEAQKALRRSLGQFPTGVTVVTVGTEGNRAGMTANSFSSVSLDPPLILWSIRRASARAVLFTEAQQFAISVLASDQVDVAMQFASSSADPFALSRWSPGQNGVALIDGAVAHFECELEAVLDGGDHHIIVGRVTHHAAHAGTPLLFAQGQFALPVQRKDELESMAGAERGMAAAPRSTIRLLRKAYSNVSGGFAEQRAALGLDPVSGRILAILEEKSASPEELAREACADLTTVTDALNDLTGKELVTQRDASRYALSQQGLQKRQQVTEQLNEYAERRFADFSKDEIDALERLLAKIGN